MVPKPSGPPFRGGEFGLPIYLLVDFLALLLVIASNIALTAQPSNLLCHKPSPYPLWLVLTLYDSSSFPFFLSLSHTPLCVCQPPFHFSSLPFYSLPLVGIQMIISPIYPTWPPLLPKIPCKLAHSKNSLETCSRIQTRSAANSP